MPELCHFLPASHSEVHQYFHPPPLCLKSTFFCTLSTFPQQQPSNPNRCFPPTSRPLPSTSLRKHEQIDPHRSFMGLGLVWDPFRECEMFWMKYDDSWVGTTDSFSVCPQNMDLGESYGEHNAPFYVGELGWPACLLHIQTVCMNLYVRIETLHREQKHNGHPLATSTEAILTHPKWIKTHYYGVAVAWR